MLELLATLKRLRQLLRLLRENNSTNLLRRDLLPSEAWELDLLLLPQPLVELKMLERKRPTTRRKRKRRKMTSQWETCSVEMITELKNLSFDFFQILFGRSVEIRD